MAETSTPPPPIQLKMRRSFGPLQPVLRAGYVGVFANALPRHVAGRIRRGDHPRAEALARSVDAISGRGLSAEERDWGERIEAARNRFDGTDMQLAATLAGLHAPWGMFLLKLVRELRPERVLELGTGIGLSSAYLAAGLDLNGSGSITSLDHQPERHATAREMLDELGSGGRVELVLGDHRKTLPEIAESLEPIDLAFVDGGKSEEIERWYVETLAPRMAPGGVIVLDDVHWSREMHRAWRWARHDQRFDLRADLWRVGVLVRASDGAPG